MTSKNKVPDKQWGEGFKSYSDVNLSEQIVT